MDSAEPALWLADFHLDWDMTPLWPDYNYVTRRDQITHCDQVKTIVTEILLPNRMAEEKLCRFREWRESEGEAAIAQTRDPPHLPI